MSKLIVKIALNMGWQKSSTKVLNFFHVTSASVISIHILIEYSTSSAKSDTLFMDKTIKLVCSFLMNPVSEIPDKSRYFQYCHNAVLLIDKFAHNCLTCSKI